MNQQRPQTHRAIELLDALRRFGGSARNAELAKAMDVSEETVRRTVKALSKSGKITRVYGGAYLGETEDRPSFFRRITENTREKRAIASTVVDNVADGTSLFLDVGSTTTFVAEELRSRRGLLVVTNSIGVAQTLVNHNENRVFLLGGEMHSDERGTFGSVAEQQVRKFRFDAAILSADGVLQRTGLVYLNPAEATLAQVAAECSDRLMVAVDHFKVGTKAPFRGPGPCDVDELISDLDPEGELARATLEWGAKLRLAFQKEDLAPNG